VTKDTKSKILEYGSQAHDLLLLPMHELPARTGSRGSMKKETLAQCFFPSAAMHNDE
jgi:hypothetical protein